MLIDFRTLFPKYGIKPRGIIQVGAHWAEEHSVYKEMGIDKIVYIEPCQEAFFKMVSTIDEPDVVFIKCACGSEEGEFEMNVSHNNQGQSNSLLSPKLHLRQHPEVLFTDKEKVQVRRLDNLTIDFDLYNILVMDCQGFEGEVLKGAVNNLHRFDLIYTEVNRDQTYQGNMLIDEMQEFLKSFGFELKEVYWPSENWSWGDAAFVRIKN